MFVVRELLYAVILFFITHFFIRSLLFKNARKLPPGPKGWPLVGALPLLGSMPHVALAEMSRKYGPIVYLKLGARGMVVASTPDSARAFLKTLDLNFSNRPTDAGATNLAYNSQDMVFADYGPRWKLLRRLSNLHMLGGKAIEDWAIVRKVELGHMLQAMYESSIRGEKVVVAEMLAFVMANMIGQVILSRRVFVTKGTESNEFKDMVVELMTSAGLFNIGDFVPSIAWTDFQGIVRGMKRLHKKFDVLLNRMFKEHMKTKHERKEKPDLLDTLMDNRDNSEGERLTDTNIKALLLVFFLRKHPSTPLNLPRVAIEACEVSGYYIPKGTRLSVNIWAIGRDPSVWENPLEFNPDRFLHGKNAKIDSRGNNFELIPFGAGRRICAGTRMGILLIEYILGTLVHSFEWKVPDGVKLNMDETFGLALQKAVPLDAIVTPRLPPSAYSV
ncbi:hypothetical protein IFM89_031413 [Coptis chinensis]|uniref:Flavonoid 3',5'-hydroxylase n=1 Tax=Coptis chinensis TaxID=261450 RepID=A0A835HE07_9MAGN|nr:hypothetical protein IFM89_031413 [Coptis chinensis]